MVEDYRPRSRRSGPLKLSTELGQMDQLGVVKCHALVNSDVMVKVTVAECDSPEQPPLVTSFPIIVIVYVVATAPLAALRLITSLSQHDRFISFFETG